LSIANVKRASTKKSFLTFIKPFQKDESVGLAETWDKVLCFRYFFGLTLAKPLLHS
jgi:hypothetical protein